MKKHLACGAAVLALSLALMSAPASAAPEAADAAMNRDWATLQTLVGDGADVNAAQADGTTALHWAVRWNDLAAADALIAAGADPNAATRLKATPLYLAAENGGAAMIETLIAAGADANLRVLENDATPLMYAARSGDVASVRALLAAGAEVDARESYRHTTALLWAAEQGQAGVIELLLAEGADPAARSAVVLPEPPAAPAPAAPTAAAATIEPAPANIADGRRPADDPAAADVEEIARAQAAAAAAAAANAEAAAAAAVEAAALRARILELGALSQDELGAIPIEALPEGARGGVTALILAARENQMEAVTALLDAGAPVNGQSTDGSTALLVAVQNANMEIARLLIDNGADVNLRNRKGWGPLFLAVKNRSIERGTMPNPVIDMDEMYAFIALLLEKGADVNARLVSETEVRNSIRSTWLLEAGATPFLRASLCGDLPVIRLLLEHGADPLIPTDDGTTPIMALAGVGYMNGFMSDVGGPAMSAEAFDLLLSLGIDVNAKNHNQVMALHGAAHKNFVYAIEKLAENGADLTAVSFRRGTFERQDDFKGHTVLDWAYGVQTGGESAVYNAEAVETVERLLDAQGLPHVRMMTTDGGRIAAAGSTSSAAE